MKKFKQVLFKAPEYLLLALVLFYWVSSSPLNPFAIGLTAIVVFQLIFKNKITGFLIGCLLLLLNLFMFLALFSEFSEFPTVNSRAIQLITVGSLIFGLGLVMSVIMIVKYTDVFEGLAEQIQDNKEQQVS